MTQSSDDVSSIHNKYSVTLLTPASFYVSLVISGALAGLLAITTYFGYLQSDDVVFRIGAIIAVLIAAQYVDSKLTKNKEFSKAVHMSLFGNIIWISIAALGLLAAFVFSKPEASLFFVAEGMFLFTSFRIGILTTVLGVNIKRAILICFIQPLSMFLVLLPPEMWSVLAEPMTLAYGLTFVGIAITWSLLTDRAGKPVVPSTHKLVQAYLSSQNQDNTEMEAIMEERSKPSTITTAQIRLKADDDSDVRLVLPDVHPGPYHPIGGSNIPYLIYKNLDSSAMVMHSVSDHALNLPSKQQVESYLESLTKSSVSQEGMTCTEPVTVQINKARAVGLLFDKNALLFLSLSPHGMEDLPNYVRSEIEQYSKNRNFERVMVVDCHNAMGEEISKIDSQDMLKAAKSCLDSLILKESYPIEFGYANSNGMNIQSLDLAHGGIGILCFKIKEKKYFLGWADANNMENGVREKIVDHFAKNSYELLEICTSDTHFSQGKVRNKNGYYQFGLVSKPETIADWYLEIAKKAEQKIKPAKFEILENVTQVKIMGGKIFEDFSYAINNSLKITKPFAFGSIALFISSLFL